MSSDLKSSSFQSHKIYVQNFDGNDQILILEKFLVETFSNFGQIIDLKILINCKVISN